MPPPFACTPECTVVPRQIKREIAEHGTDEDKECLHYVLYEKAGTSTTRFANGVRDQGRENETFDDFCMHPDCKECHLEPAHVLALRLYSTAAYKSINGAAAIAQQQPPPPPPPARALSHQGPTHCPTPPPRRPAA